MASGPAPPPHGAHHKTFEMPTGNVDVFVIPSHSAGSGFLYLPSLQPQWNSFCAGVACTLLGVQFYHLLVPVLKHWMASVAASGGMAVVLVVVCVGVLGWAWGKTQSETRRAEAKGNDHNGGGESRTGSAEYESGPQNQAPPPPPPPPPPRNEGPYNASSPPPPPPPRNEGPYNASSQPHPSAGAAPQAGTKPSWQPPKSTPATSEWERAREETRKKEEERRKKELAETKAREAAEKDKWEKARAREKETRERETREKVAKERREKELRERTEREAKERLEKAKAEGSSVGSKTYYKPTAQSFIDEEEAYSFRPYDTPKRTAGTNSHSSAQSESSYAPSHSTARTTPPQTHRGPYSTKDEEKIVIDAVFAFNDKFQKPAAELISGTGSVTDGLVLKLTSEGLFIDDDVRDEPQREWDVKAWTLKQIESGEYNGKHVVRASKRDADNTKYIFVINQSEGWKIAKGLLRLRRSPQVRSLGHSGLSTSATMAILNSVGYA